MAGLIFLGLLVTSVVVGCVTDLAAFGSVMRTTGAGSAPSSASLALRRYSVSGSVRRSRRGHGGSGALERGRRGGRPYPCCSGGSRLDIASSSANRASIRSSLTSRCLGWAATGLHLMPLRRLPIHPLILSLNDRRRASAPRERRAKIGGCPTCTNDDHVVVLLACHPRLLPVAGQRQPGVTGSASSRSRSSRRRAQRFHGSESPGTSRSSAACPWSRV